MVTNSIRHKHQQTTNNTKYRTQNSNWVHNRHKHTTSTRQNTQTTHKGRPPTTRITDKTKSQHPTHPLHYITTQQTTHIRKKQTTYSTTDYTTDIDTKPTTIDGAKIKTNMKHIITNIVNTYLNNSQHNEVTNTITLTVHHSETTLPRATRHTLVQLSTNKCRQNRRRQTPITTMPRTTHTNTLIQLHQHKHTPKGHGCRLDGGYHRPVCVETVVGRWWRVGPAITPHSSPCCPADFT